MYKMTDEASLRAAIDVYMKFKQKKNRSKDFTAKRRWKYEAEH